MDVLEISCIVRGKEVGTILNDPPEPQICLWIDEYVDQGCALEDIELRMFKSPQHIKMDESIWDLTADVWMLEYTTGSL